LSYPPNIKAAQLIIQKLSSLVPERTCLIAGANNDGDQLSNKSSNCTILGYQEDIRDVYHNAKVMVVPIDSGSGQQNKVLEAMACGIPSIVTSFVNEAIGAEPGKEVIIADDVETFAERINELLSQPELYQSVKKAGRLYVERRFNWNVNTRALVDGLLS